MSATDVSQYCDLMQQVKYRVSIIDGVALGTAGTLQEWVSVEVCCLQLRKCLELVAFGSLVANRIAYTSVYKNFENTWNADLLLRDIERLNPEFYPKPVIDKPSQTAAVKSHLADRGNDYLTRSEFVKVYKKCAALMHASNPYGSKIHFAFYKRHIPLWRDRIVNLLDTHVVRLAPESFYLIHMRESGDDKVHGYTFVPKN